MALQRKQESIAVQKVYLYLICSNLCFKDSYQNVTNNIPN